MDKERMSAARRLTGMVRSMLTLSLSAFALVAQTPQPIPQVISHGEGVVSVKPDQVRIQIGVTNQAPTASEAGAQNAKQSAAVIAELKQQLGTAAEYQTSNYSLYPNYRTQRDGGNPTISGYQATNTVEVKLNDITLAGKAVDVATKTGANRIQGIHFSIRNEQAVRGQALAAAATQARANAEALAKAVGLRIVKLLRVEDGEPVRVMPMRSEIMMMAKSADAASTPVEAGEIEVRATVTITAEVAP